MGGAILAEYCALRYGLIRGQTGGGGEGDRLARTRWAAITGAGLTGWIVGVTRLMYCI